MKENRWRPALKAAFPHTIPIMTGFLFLGMAYGILMRTKGFHPLFPTVMAMTIFGGSLEYVAAEMLLSAFAPVETLLMALLIQARHLFYGLAMLDKYRGLGWKTPLLIFGMCDESFSINCSVEVPKDIDKGWFYLWVSHGAELGILGHRGDHRRAAGRGAALQYRGPRFCHDGDVRGHLPGKLAEGKAALVIPDRPGLLGGLPADLRGGGLHAADDGGDPPVPGGIAPSH